MNQKNITYDMVTLDKKLSIVCQKYRKDMMWYKKLEVLHSMRWINKNTRYGWVRRWSAPEEIIANVLSFIQAYDS